jgi:hypothetical protein
MPINNTQFPCADEPAGGSCFSQGCPTEDKGPEETCCQRYGGDVSQWDEDARSACIEDDGDWVPDGDPEAPIMEDDYFGCPSAVCNRYCWGSSSGSGWWSYITLNPVILVRCDCPSFTCWRVRCQPYKCETTTTPPPSSYGVFSAKTKIFNIIKSKENKNEK